VAADRQAEPGPAVLAGGRRFGLAEGLEQPIQLLRVHADAGVADGEADLLGAIGRLARDGQRDRAVVGELGGVAEQVEERLANLGQVGPHGTRVVDTAHLEGVGVLLHQRLDDRHHVGDHVRDAELLEIELHLAGLDLGQVQDVVDQPQQVLAGAVDLLEVGDEFFLAEVLGLLLEHLAVADDRVERGPQLMGHVGQELGLVAAGDLQLAALVLQLLEQARVLDRKRRLGREGLEALDGLRCERTGLPTPDHQRADQPVLAEDRHHQHSSKAFAIEDVAERIVRQVLDIRDLGRRPVQRGLPDNRLAEVDPGIAQGGNELEARPVVRARHEHLLGPVELVDRPDVGAGELDRVRHNPFEHLLQVECRVDRLADLAERLQLLDRTLQLLEQPGVLDRDDRLVGERLQQLDLLVG